MNITTNPCVLYQGQPLLAMGSSDTPQNPLFWTPTPGVTYLVVIQCSLQSENDVDHTVAVQYSIFNACGSMGSPIAAQTVTIKDASGGPGPMPTVYLTFVANTTTTPNWNGGDVVVTVAPLQYANQFSPAVTTGDERFLSAVVLELDQLSPGR